MPSYPANLPTTSSDAGGLTLNLRGTTIRLEAGDPRIEFIEFVLFRRQLPPPLSLHGLPAAPPSPMDAPEPRVAVPEAWLSFWEAVPEDVRRYLAVLSREELTTPFIEQKLGLAKGGTRSLTTALAIQAQRAGLDTPVKGIGDGRGTRRYFVAEEARPIVLELERRWSMVREALRQARGYSQDASSSQPPDSGVVAPSSDSAPAATDSQ